MFTASSKRWWKKHGDCREVKRAVFGGMVTSEMAAESRGRCCSDSPEVLRRPDKDADIDTVGFPLFGGRDARAFMMVCSGTEESAE